MSNNVNVCLLALAYKWTLTIVFAVEEKDFYLYFKFTIHDKTILLECYTFFSPTPYSVIKASVVLISYRL